MLLLVLFRDYILRGGTLLPLDHFELNLLALLQGFEAFTLNCAVVNEDIVTAGTLNEAKTLLVVKPLYCSTLAIGHLPDSPSRRFTLNN